MDTKGFTGNVSYAYPNGNNYDGDFMNDLPNGKGVMRFPNHDKYEGDWVDGEMTGKGEYLFYDKNRDKLIWKYEGWFENSRFHGLGKMTYPDRTVYFGEWAEGKRNGYGQQMYASGDILSGVWEKDTVIYGTYLFADGSKYIGHFQNFRYSGFGTFCSQDGTILQGDWKNCRLVNGAEYKPNGEICKIEDNQKVIYDY